MSTAWRSLNASRDHRWAQSRISPYLDSELSARAERRLLAHQELCPECDELIRALAGLLAVLPMLKLPPEDSLAIAERSAEHVRARIAEWA